MTAPDHRYLFIGGVHRSGTTMLARLVAEHPDVSGFAGTGAPADEGQHLQTVWEPPSKGRQAGRFGLAAGAHVTETSSLVTEVNRRRLLAEWGRYWDRSRPVLLEKSPPNILMSRFLQAMLPPAAFVFVVRHPVAAACATQKWSATRPHQLLHHWAVVHRTALADARRLECVLVVRYEDLIRDPDRAVARVLALVGLADHAPGRAVAAGVNPDNFAADRTLRAEVNEQYFASWRRRKRHPLKRAYLAALELRHERGAAAFGYSLRRLETGDPADPFVARLLAGPAP